MTLFLRRSTLAAAAAALSLSALAQAPATPANIASNATADPAVVAPNANLHLEGIPPIPKSIADSVAQYTEFRGHRYVGWRGPFSSPAMRCS